nr:hypothetical protein Iba_chr03dCG4590 [Ipomoea batatas]
MVLEQDQVTVVVENLVEACVTNETQVEVPSKDLVEEPVEEETTTEVEEQVMIPNVINAENISNSVTVPVEVICEGVVTAQDETFVETNLDESQHENATDVPTATQSHEMDTTENLPNTLEDTNENLFDNLIDTQVIAHLQDFESDDEEASLKSTKRRKIIMFESSDSNIYKQMQRLSDHQKNLNDAMQEYNEKKEKDWDEKFAALSKKIEAESCRGNNFTLAQCQSLLKVIHQQEDKISALHNELTTFRCEHTAKVDKIHNNVEKLLDYAKKGEESSHLALGTSIPVESNVGRGKGKGVLGFSDFASNDPRPKFGAIQYFNDERTAPYTMKDVPAIMRKQSKGDQRLWVAERNKELKKGKSPANSNINMLKEIEKYVGNSVTEAYSYYITGQVYDEYFVDEYVEDFRKLREHINKML